MDSVWVENRETELEGWFCLERLFFGQSGYELSSWAFLRARMPM